LCCYEYQLSAYSNLQQVLTQQVLTQLDALLVSLLFLCAAQEDMRETSLSELHYEDLEKLPPDEVTRVAEWLTEKVDALSSRLKAEQREDEVRAAAAAVQWSAQLWLAGQRLPG
jgi:hypothetical protein